MYSKKITLDTLLTLLCLLFRAPDMLTKPTAVFTGRKLAKANRCPMVIIKRKLHGLTVYPAMCEWAISEQAYEKSEVVDTVYPN